METNSEMVISKKRLWAGRIISALPVAMLLLSASFKLMRSPEFEKNFAEFGYSIKSALPIGIVEIACAVLFLIPRTSVLGAILVTGYLGGATATHARVGQPQLVMPVILGMLAWLGLLLREPRLGALIPFRK